MNRRPIRQLNYVAFRERSEEELRRTGSIRGEEQSLVTREERAVEEIGRMIDRRMRGNLANPRTGCRGHDTIAPRSAIRFPSLVVQV